MDCAGALYTKSPVTSLRTVFCTFISLATSLCGLKVRWFNGSVAQLIDRFDGSTDCWFVRSMDRWFDGLLVRWFDGSLVRWFDGLVIQWFAGLMVRWIAGSMDRWFDGSIDRWFDGSMDRWFAGSMDRWFDVGYFRETYLRQFESADHKF